MKKSLIVTTMIFLLVFSYKSISTGQNHMEAVSIQPAQDDTTGKSTVEHKFKFEDDTVTPYINIHYTGKYCNECHEKTPVEGGDPYLKFGGDYKQLCRCHDLIPAGYIHPVDIKPSPEKAKRIPADFPLPNGQLTCVTCHNIYLQCQKRTFNRNSLRGAPYSQRTDFCYQCHIKENYESLDPHHQINDQGEIVIENCLICHDEKPDEKHATFKDVKFIGDIEMMCRRCHHIAGNHSGNANHIGVKPSENGLKRIEAMEIKYNARLPLDENGKMTCITCHNPHEKGVIPDNSPGAKGASSKYRLRLPENLCQECHQM
jgi:hypothetical protein